MAIDSSKLVTIASLCFLILAGVSGIIVQTRDSWNLQAASWLELNLDKTSGIGLQDTIKYSVNILQPQGPFDYEIAIMTVNIIAIAEGSNATSIPAGEFVLPVFESQENHKYNVTLQLRVRRGNLIQKVDKLLFMTPPAQGARLKLLTSRIEQTLETLPLNMGNVNSLLYSAQAAFSRYTTLPFVGMTQTHIQDIHRHNVYCDGKGTWSPTGGENACRCNSGYEGFACTYKQGEAAIIEDLVLRLVKAMNGFRVVNSDSVVLVTSAIAILAKSRSLYSQPIGFATLDVAVKVLSHWNDTAVRDATFLDSIFSITVKNNQLYFSLGKFDERTYSYFVNTGLKSDTLLYKLISRIIAISPPAPAPVKEIVYQGGSTSLRIKRIADLDYNGKISHYDMSFEIRKRLLPQMVTSDSYLTLQVFQANPTALIGSDELNFYFPILESRLYGPAGNELYLKNTTIKDGATFTWEFSTRFPRPVQCAYYNGVAKMFIVDKYVCQYRTSSSSVSSRHTHWCNCAFISGTVALVEQRLGPTQGPNPFMSRNLTGVCTGTSDYLVDSVCQACPRGSVCATCGPRCEKCGANGGCAKCAKGTVLLGKRCVEYIFYNQCDAEWKNIEIYSLVKPEEPTNMCNEGDILTSLAMALTTHGIRCGDICTPEETGKRLNQKLILAADVQGRKLTELSFFGLEYIGLQKGTDQAKANYLGKPGYIVLLRQRGRWVLAYDFQNGTVSYHDPKGRPNQTGSLFLFDAARIFKLI